MATNNETETKACGQYGTMTDYMCRAEFPPDVDKVRQAFVDAGVKIEKDIVTQGGPFPGPFPDRLWEFSVSSSHTLDDLVKIAKTLEDVHVMWQTLERKENYTGVRKR